MIKKILDLDEIAILRESALSYSFASKQSNLSLRYKAFQRAKILGKIAKEIKNLKKIIVGDEK